MDDLHRQLNYRIRALQFAQQNRHPNSHDAWLQNLHPQMGGGQYLHPHMDIKAGPPGLEPGTG